MFKEKKLLLPIMQILMIITITSCDLINKDDDDSGKEPFKSMYNDDSQIILMPLAEAYKWIYKIDYYDSTGTSIARTEYDTVQITGKRTVAGTTLYIKNGTNNGFVLKSDTIFFNAKQSGNNLDYGNLKFYISTKLRNAHDAHNGTAFYHTGGDKYELTAAVNSQTVELESGPIITNGPSYKKENKTELVEYHFADWRNVVETFFGLVKTTAYKDKNHSKRDYESKLIKFEHPDFD